MSLTSALNISGAESPSGRTPPREAQENNKDTGITVGERAYLRWVSLTVEEAMEKPLEEVLSEKDYRLVWRFVEDRWELALLMAWQRYKGGTTKKDTKSETTLRDEEQFDSPLGGGW